MNQSEYLNQAKKTLLYGAAQSDEAVLTGADIGAVLEEDVANHYKTSRGVPIIPKGFFTKYKDADTRLPAVKNAFDVNLEGLVDATDEKRIRGAVRAGVPKTADEAFDLIKRTRPDAEYPNERIVNAHMHYGKLTYLVTAKDDDEHKYPGLSAAAIEGAPEGWEATASAVVATGDKNTLNYMGKVLQADSEEDLKDEFKGRFSKTLKMGKLRHYLTDRKVRVLNGITDAKEKALAVAKMYLGQEQTQES
jgi:hypothetical protein